jgi:hypothetical protein
MIKAAIVVLAMVFTVAVAPAAPTAAASPVTTFGAACANTVAFFLGFQTWDSCLDHAPGGAPRIQGINDIWIIILTLMDDFIKAAGYAAVGFVVWGGIKYTKSQGAPGETEQARQIIYNALFGLVIVLISVAIINLIMSGF